MRRAVALTLFTILVAAGHAAGQSGRSAAPLLRGFFTALGEGNPEAMVSFLEANATDDFRSSRTADEWRALVERIGNDLGSLEVRGMERVSEDRALAMVAAEKTGTPVEFAFDLADGKLAGLSIRVGGGMSRDRVLDLPRGASDEELLRAANAQLAAKAKEGEFSGVVLVARDGEPVFHRAYGLADRAGDRALTTGTWFDVGSITKMVTKIAIAQLAEAGKLELDDPLALHMPDYPNEGAARKITIRHLTEHSSGLGDIFNSRWSEADKSRFIEPEDFFQLFADAPLQFEPGEGRAYSNAGYITLGAVVAAVSGQRYFDYVQEKIFAPAGMSDSGFPVKDGSGEELAIGYTRGGPGDHASTGPVRSNLGMLPIRGCPAGSSMHTALDLLRLDRALRSGKLVDPEWTAWVFGPGYKDDLATAVIGVAGGGPGVSAGWESDGATTVIGLANLDSPSGAEVALELFQALSSR